MEATPEFGDSVQDPVVTPGFVGTPSDDPGTDVEDELEYVSPLPTMISLIPDSDAASPMSPAGYLEPPLPALVGSPTTLPVENALQTRDQFLPYTVLPEHVLCAPVVSPVMMDSPATREFPSPGSPAAMDRILAGDVDLLMDNESDLPSLPSSLLPVPSPRVLPPEPPVVPSAGGLPDLSQQNPFNISQDSSVSGASWIICRDASIARRRTRILRRRPHIRATAFSCRTRGFLEYVGTPESARLLTRWPEYWLHHMTHDEDVVAALQLQHDAGLMMTNLQILSQFVTSLNWISSEVLQLAFGREQFPADAMQAVLPSSRVRRGPITWQLWDCGGPRIARASPGLCRSLPAMTVQCV